ncbi:MAG: lipoprotein signal peptidase [Bacteroidia bacterium]|nr:lipoprotein signal peptidase [Bacteroidia bacterium]
MRLLHKSLLTVFLILLIDQVLKFWVKTTMFLGQTESIIDGWFLLSFVENDGMAFGIDIPGGFGKIALSLFRIVAVIFIGWYLFRQTQKKAPLGLIICLSMVLAGAFGNIIDSCFYGLLFSSSIQGQIASFLPEGGGYATFLHGSVVDMFRFQIDWYWPKWTPWVGGRYFDLFPPVFNIADASITTGIAALIIFQKRLFRKEKANAA